MSYTQKHINGYKTGELYLNAYKEENKNKSTMRYYNTTNESGSTLKEYAAKTEKQDEVILSVMQPKNGLTPFGVQSLLRSKGYDYPITSIRRALNTLTQENKLTKLDKKRPGKYGRANHVWVLNT